MLAFAAALVFAAAAVQDTQTRQQAATTSGYLTPTKVIVDILDAPATRLPFFTQAGRQTRLPLLCEMGEGLLHP